jgi:hypothetical protein
MQKWEAQFLNRRLLIINEELTFHKMVECTQITELQNRGKFLNATLYVWEWYPLMASGWEESVFVVKKRTNSNKQEVFQTGHWYAFLHGPRTSSRGVCGRSLLYLQSEIFYFWLNKYSFMWLFFLLLPPALTYYRSERLSWLCSSLKLCTVVGYPYSIMVFCFSPETSNPLDYALYAKFSLNVCFSVKLLHFF